MDQLKLPLVESAEIKNPFILPDHDFQKSPVLDILATDESGRSFNVEMQNLNQSQLVKRSIYYGSRGYSDSLKQGEDYNALRPRYMIMFVRFPIPRCPPDRRIECFQLTSIFDPNLRLDDITLIFVRVPAEGEIVPPGVFNRELDDWTRFMASDAVEKTELAAITKRNPILGSLEEKLDRFLAQEDVRMWIDNEELRKMEQRMEIKEAVEQAVAQAVEQAEVRTKVQQGRSTIEKILTGRFPSEFRRYADAIKAKLGVKTSSELEDLFLATATCGSVQEFVALL